MLNGGGEWRPPIRKVRPPLTGRIGGAVPLAAKDVINDFTTKIDVASRVRGAVSRNLTPVFGRRRLAGLTQPL
jgi:hypothetical protein